MKGKILLFLFATLALPAMRVSADVLRAADVIIATNIDWAAFIHAQKSVRMGKQVDFILPDYPTASYAEIRRALWIAALHGITRQTSEDAHTRQLMESELKLMRFRLSESFVFDVAIRETKAADRLIPLMIPAQINCLLIGLDEKSPLKSKSTLLCQGDGITAEDSDIFLPSPSTAVSFVQAGHSDFDLIFETDGRVATDIFVRRFRDGTMTVVNLTDRTRRNLTCRNGYARLTFDLYPADVLHLLQHEPPRLTRESKERFITGLWQIAFEKDSPPCVITAEELLTAVPENYRGTLRYQTTVCVPTGVKTLFLGLRTGSSETEVLINGKSLGVRAWEPFEWAIPGIHRGQDVSVEIRVEKQTIKGGLLTIPSWRSH